MSAVIDAGLHVRRPDNRAFNYAILFSLLLHGAVLFSFSMKPPKSPPSTPGPIIARLAPPPSASAAAQPAQPEPPKPRVEEPPPPPPQVKPVPQPKPRPIARTDPAPAAPTLSPDSGTLETYRMDLMRMARNYKRYPRVAMDNNWEGRVVIRMIIGANGMISTISIVDSAGHEVLDKQALDMIQKAKPRVQIPPALRGKEFSLEIPVIYSLKEGDAG
jgi:protein TonB